MRIVCSSLLLHNLSVTIQELLVLCYYITYRWQYENSLFFFVITLSICVNMRMNGLFFVITLPLGDNMRMVSSLLLHYL